MDITAVENPIFGLKTCVFRMSCLYGPHQYGNEDQGWLAHFLISAVLDRPIAIYGDGYQLRDALSCSLEILGSEPLKPIASSNGGPARYVFPNLDARHGADPTWSATLETLRAPPENGKHDFSWRKESPILPVVFSAPEGIDDEIVQLHLSHRVVQRLLGRFLSQGFIHHDLSRACLAQSADAIPRVILLGRVRGPVWVMS